MQARNERHPSSWWMLNRKWVIPVGMVLLLLAFVGSVLGFVFGSMRSSEPVALAVEHAGRNAEVVNAIGEPIEVGWFVTGSVSVNGPSGEAGLSVPVTGPRGSATLYLAATKSLGQWSLDRLEAELPGQAGRFDLLGDAPW